MILTDGLYGRDGAPRRPRWRFPVLGPAELGSYPAADGEAPDSGRRSAPSLPKQSTKNGRDIAPRRPRWRFPDFWPAELILAGGHLFWGQRNRGAIRRRNGKRRIADGAARHPYLIGLKPRVGYNDIWLQLCDKRLKGGGRRAEYGAKSDRNVVINS